MFEWHKKEKPFLGMAGMGGGVASKLIAGTSINYLLSSGISATGGSATLTPGDGYKYHFFTSTGSNPFNVTGVTGTGYVEYVIIAGGGGGGSDGGGGGGAGGFRTNAGILNYLTNGSGAHPLSGLTESDVITATVQNYTFTVGTGGVAGVGNENPGGAGNPSSAFGLTAAGGGKGIGWGGNAPGQMPSNGGSGGGRGSNNAGGSLGLPYNPVDFRLGNSPPTSPPQGNPGGGGGTANRAGGGGGAGAAGQDGGPSSQGVGGDGVPVSQFTIPASYGTTGPQPGRWFAGGGGGGWSPSPGPNVSGGAGGGGTGVGGGTGSSGTANTGGGGGGGYENDGNGGPGGSGIIIVRYLI